MLKKVGAVSFVFLPAVAMAEEGQSMISLILGNAGFAGFTTIGLSVIAFMLVFKMVLDLKSEKIMPSSLVEDVESALQEEDYEGAYSAVEDDGSYLGRV